MRKPSEGPDGDTGERVSEGVTQAGWHSYVTQAPTNYALS
jgi:hypothetical protein